MAECQEEAEVEVRRTAEVRSVGGRDSKTSLHRKAGYCEEAEEEYVDHPRQ